MNTFDDGQPEKLLSLLRNFKIVIDGTGLQLYPVGLTTYVRCYAGSH